MSRNGTLLPIPPGASAAFQTLIDAWPDPQRWPYRSRWLKDFETLLLVYAPLSSSADRRLTARNHAPFPLRDGPNVP